MSGQALRLLFAGTPEFAAAHLQALLDSRHDVLAVYTQPDRPAGRGRRLQASPTGALAAQAGIPCLKPLKLDQHACAEMGAWQADLLIVVAYGLILPAAALTAAGLGAINVHASLLPRWRGAAPIQRAIEAGDETTGVCIMQMDEGLDTGPVLARAQIPIEGNATAGTLHDELVTAGTRTLVDTLDRISAGNPPEPQIQPQSGISYARKLDKREAAIDWSLPAPQIERRIRAFNPWPVCTAQCQEDRIRIWLAEVVAGRCGAPGEILEAQGPEWLVACGEGALRILEAQWPGGRRLGTAELLRARAARLHAAGRLE